MTFDLFSFLVGVGVCYVAMELFVIPPLSHVIRVAHDRRR